MSPAVAYRGTVLLLWGLAAWNALACRGLFWDGASFLANVLETGTSMTSTRLAPTSPG